LCSRLNILLPIVHHHVACRISKSFNREFIVWRISCAEVLLKMQRGDVSSAKRARVVSRNEIRGIVMDSDSDEERYYPSQESEDKKEPLPPSRRSSISQTFLLAETVFRIITQRPTYKTYFRPSSVKTVEASTTI
jgi:hypothetical protein